MRLNPHRKRVFGEGAVVFGWGSAPSKREPSAPSAGGSLAQMVTSAGRVDLGWLQRLALSAPSEEFVRFVRRPVLAGSSLHQATLPSWPFGCVFFCAVLFVLVYYCVVVLVSVCLRHA